MFHCSFARRTSHLQRRKSKPHSSLPFFCNKSITITTKQIKLSISRQNNTLSNETQVHPCLQMDLPYFLTTEPQLGEISLPHSMNKLIKSTSSRHMRLDWMALPALICSNSLFYTILFQIMVQASGTDILQVLRDLPSLHHLPLQHALLHPRTQFRLGLHPNFFCIAKGVFREILQATYLPPVRLYFRFFFFSLSVQDPRN